MGSLSKLGEGRYRLRVEREPDPATGRRRWHSETCRGSRKDCARRLARLAADPAAIASGESFGRYVRERWLPHYAATWRPSSFRQRRVAMERWLLPEFGAVPLGTLAAGRIERGFAAMRLAGASPNRVRELLIVLNAALNQAVRWELLPRNPAQHVRLPAPPPPEPARLWSPAQFRRFLDTQAGAWRMLWLVLAGTGMRIAEARALRWGDVDWETPALSVARTFARGERGEYLSAPKSAAGRRLVVIGAGLRTALRGWRREQLAARWAAGLPDAPDGYVLARGDGSPLPAGSVHGIWRAGIAAAEVPYAKIHALRHLAVTAQLAAGIPLKTVSARIGHGSLRLTSDLYGHVLAEHQTAAAAVLDGLIAGTRDQNVTELPRDDHNTASERG